MLRQTTYSMDQLKEKLGLSKKEVLICVAPNGARKMKTDNEGLPISPDELATTAKSCRDAGASMIHLHVRDDAGKHTILPEYYRPAIQAVREAIGDEMVIQITTEAVGQYSPEEQMATVRELKPEAVSLALKELAPEGKEEEAGAFFKWVHDNGILAQYILYSPEEIERFIDLHKQGIIPETTPNILLVLGRYSKNLTSEPEDLVPMLAALKDFPCIWAVCAFGPREADCMAFAVEQGGHCRIGFENNMHLPDGTLAVDNASLIQGVVSDMAVHDFTPISGKKARDIYIRAGQ